MPEDPREDPLGTGQTIHEWNPGGLGNAAGSDLATPSSTWNPNATGNVDEVDRETELIPIDDPAGTPPPPGPENPTL